MIKAFLDRRHFAAETVKGWEKVVGGTNSRPSTRQCRDCWLAMCLTISLQISHSALVPTPYLQRQDKLHGSFRRRSNAPAVNLVLFSHRRGKPGSYFTPCSEVAHVRSLGTSLLAVIRPPISPLSLRSFESWRSPFLRLNPSATTASPSRTDYVLQLPLHKTVLHIRFASRQLYTGSNIVQLRAFSAFGH
ncbi:hypothetical protein BCV70DRAFT_21865 [Testicularia cyperi]|uniref:Uncharacterized protein n=1 Tax=Testicularia cyperi TaxID=1882483 RepID=A0A317Y0L3_9BASI|nr:hypothetical protein BCV70DRAFT_21865 [Testicularia cyperi]